MGKDACAGLRDSGRPPLRGDRDTAPPNGRHMPTSIYFNLILTPDTAADNSTPTFGPLSCRDTPFAFCN